MEIHCTSSNIFVVLLFRDLRDPVKIIPFKGCCPFYSSQLLLALGKTTLLSTLSLRIDTYQMNVAGDIRLNGKPYTKHDLKCMSGYVMQGVLSIIVHF